MTATDCPTDCLDMPAAGRPQVLITFGRAHACRASRYACWRWWAPWPPAIDQRGGRCLKVRYMT